MFRIPLLSVVVPVHGTERYLPYCLDSILAEAGDELEIVAVDDCSPDGSGALLDAYAARDRRVRVVHLDANVGLGRARNAGLDRARGHYVWFVDSDDWLPAGALPAVRRRLVATRPDVLIVDHTEVRSDGRAEPTGGGTVLRETAAAAPVRLEQRPELLRLPLATSACTKVTRRELLVETGLRFPPGWYEDCAFAYPLLLAAERIDALDRVCYRYRQRPDGAITKSVSPRHREVLAQYARMWTHLERVAALRPGGTEALRQLRPELFRAVIDHLLVVAGNDHRLPSACRREFFRQVVGHYRRHRPDGYRPPGGGAGVRHRVVRANAYPVYAALRLGRRWLRRGSRPEMALAPAAGPVGSGLSPAPFRSRTTGSPLA